MVETTINRYLDHDVLKSSGGIRNYEQAERFVDMGCERLCNGFGSTPSICEGARESLEEGY